MVKMQAKLKVVSVKVTEYGEILEMTPVCSKSFDQNGESEDNTFARFTPSGSVILTVNNPTLAGQFKPGQMFYVDFAEVDQEV